MECGDGWREIPKHFSGFLAAYENLVTSTDNDAEVLSLKILYANLLRHLNFRIYYQCHPPDETVLTYIASGNIARLIASTTRAVDLGDTIGSCERSAEIRIQLLQMLLHHEIATQMLGSASYSEGELVLRAVKHHLHSLSRTFQSASCHLLLAQLQILGPPPFSDKEVFLSVTNLVLIDEFRGCWSCILLRSCAYYLLSTVLFEGQCVNNNFEFPVVEAALTICRIVAVHMEASLFHDWYAYVVCPALLLAGLTLAELRLPDGISS